MEKKIYLAVNGLGLGHAGRSVEIANALKDRGLPVVFSSYGEAVKYISRMGYACHEVPEFPLYWGGAGEVDLKATVQYFLTSSSRIVLSQIGQEIRLLKKHRPSAVLADSRSSAMVAARLHGLPLFSLTNQLIAYSPSHDGSKRVSGLLNFVSPRLLPRLWGLSTHVFIADFPPPHTVSMRNIEPGLRYLRSFSFVGPLIKKQTLRGDYEEKFRAFFKDDSRPLVYAPVSGPGEDRRFFLRLLEEALPHLTDEFNIVLSKGNPGGSEQPSYRDGYAVFEWLPWRMEMINCAHILLSRAGRTTIDQAIVLRKPVILVPASKQTEQEENARRVSELGIGLCLEQGKFSKESLRITIQKMMRDYDFYLGNLDLLARRAVELGGVEKIVDTLLQLL